MGVYCCLLTTSGHVDTIYFRPAQMVSVMYLTYCFVLSDLQGMARVLFLSSKIQYLNWEILKRGKICGVAQFALLIIL